MADRSRPAAYAEPRGDCLTVDRDLVAAIAWCRIGGQKLGRPKDDHAFHRAKSLGLLAQDDVWRATERGEGVLIALGLLEGEPAPRRTTMHVLWARSSRYPQPQLVRVWTDGFVDMQPDEYEEQRAAAKREHDAYFGDRLLHGRWSYWTTVEHLEQPSEPVREEVGDAR